MPILKDFRQTKKITLKNHEGGEIEIFNSVLARDSDGLTELQENPGKISLLLDALPKFIKSWNFQDDKGVLLPINGDNLNLFSMDDLTEIVDAIKDFSESLKKK